MPSGHGAGSRATQFKKQGGWKPGQSGNPQGRPPGSRTALAEAFLKDVLSDWQTHGAAAIVTFRDERPHDYVRMVARLLPKELNVKVSEFENLTDEQLSTQLASVLKRLERSAKPRGRGGKKTTAQPPSDVPTVQ